MEEITKSKPWFIRVILIELVRNVSKNGPPLAKPTRPTAGSTVLYKIKLSFIYLGPFRDRISSWLRSGYPKIPKHALRTGRIKETLKFQMVTGHSETTFQAFKKTEKYTMKEYKKGPPQRLSDFRLSLGKNGLRFHHGSNSG